VLTAVTFHLDHPICSCGSEGFAVTIRTDGEDSRLEVCCRRCGTTMTAPLANLKVQIAVTPRTAPPAPAPSPSPKPKLTGIAGGKVIPMGNPKGAA